VKRLQACGGLGYTFAVYSQHLKDTLQYDQEDLDGIGAAKDFGYALGIVGGILYHFMPPWMVVGIGAILHFMGYFMVKLLYLRFSALYLLLLFIDVITCKLNSTKLENFDERINVKSL
jgi:hypothetical protein